MSDFENWVAARNEHWSNKTGWLSITGFHWVTEEPTQFVGVDGTWWAQGHTAFAKGLDGDNVSSWFVAQGANVFIDHGDVQFELAIRGGQILLRPHSPAAPLLELFDGVRVFDFNPALKVTATLEPVPPRTNGDYEVAGQLAFELDGEPVRLTAYLRDDPDELWVIFRDATSKRDTASSGRNLTAKRAGDHWVLDFNYAQNFPCAYSDFTTCPLPPAENVLAIELTAGEKRPPYRVTADGVVVQ